MFMSHRFDRHEDGRLTVCGRTFLKITNSSHLLKTDASDVAVRVTSSHWHLDSTHYTCGTIWPSTCHPRQMHYQHLKSLPLIETWPNIEWLRTRAFPFLQLDFVHHPTINVWPSAAVKLLRIIRFLVVALSTIYKLSAWRDFWGNSSILVVTSLYGSDEQGSNNSHDWNGIAHTYDTQSTLKYNEVSVLYQSAGSIDDMHTVYSALS